MFYLAHIIFLKISCQYLKWEFSHKNLDIWSRLLWENVPMGQQSTKPHCVVASPLDQACPLVFATVPTILYDHPAWIPSFMKSVWPTETLELALSLSYCVTFGSPGAIFLSCSVPGAGKHCGAVSVPFAWIY